MKKYITATILMQICMVCFGQGALKPQFVIQQTPKGIFKQSLFSKDDNYLINVYTTNSGSELQTWDIHTAKLLLNIDINGEFSDHARLLDTYPYLELGGYIINFLNGERFLRSEEPENNAMSFGYEITDFGQYRTVRHEPADMDQKINGFLSRLGASLHERYGDTILVVNQNVVYLYRVNGFKLVKTIKTDIGQAKRLNILDSSLCILNTAGEVYVYVLPQFKLKYKYHLKMTDKRDYDYPHLLSHGDDLGISGLHKVQDENSATILDSMDDDVIINLKENKEVFRQPRNIYDKSNNFQTQSSQTGRFILSGNSNFSNLIDGRITDSRSGKVLVTVSAESVYFMRGDSSILVVSYYTPDDMLQMEVLNVENDYAPRIIKLPFAQYDHHIERKSDGSVLINGTQRKRLNSYSSKTIYAVYSMDMKTLDTVNLSQRYNLPAEVNHDQQKVCFNADGKRLLIIDGPLAKVSDQDGKLVDSLSLPDKLVKQLKENYLDMIHIQLSADGNYIFYDNIDDSKLWVYEIPSHRDVSSYFSKTEELPLYRFSWLYEDSICYGIRMNNDLSKTAPLTLTAFNYFTGARYNGHLAKFTTGTLHGFDIDKASKTIQYAATDFGGVKTEISEFNCIVFQSLVNDSILSKIDLPKAAKEAGYDNGMYYFYSRDRHLLSYASDELVVWDTDKRSIVCHEKEPGAKFVVPFYLSKDEDVVVYYVADQSDKLSIKARRLSTGKPTFEQKYEAGMDRIIAANPAYIFMKRADNDFDVIQPGQEIKVKVLKLLEGDKKHSYLLSSKNFAYSQNDRYISYTAQSGQTILYGASDLRTLTKLSASDMPEYLHVLQASMSDPAVNLSFQQYGWGEPVYLSLHNGIHIQGPYVSSSDHRLWYYRYDTLAKMDPIYVPSYFSPDLNLMAHYDTRFEGQLTVNDRRTGRELYRKKGKEFIWPNQDINKLDLGYVIFSRDDRWMAYNTTAKNKITLVDLGQKSETEIRHAGIRPFTFMDTELWLTTADSILIYDTHGRLKSSIPSPPGGYILQNGKYLSVAESEVALYGLSTRKQIYDTLLEPVSSFKVDEKSGRLAIIYKSGLLALYHLLDFSIIDTFHVDNMDVGSWSFLDSAKIAIAYAGMIEFIDLSRRFLPLYFIPSYADMGEAKDYVLFNRDGYYMGSKSMMANLAFRLGDRVYPFDQFDLRFNRPDIILKQLGYADTALVSSYQSAYLKRLKRLNFTGQMLSGDLHLPEADIPGRDTMPVTVYSPLLHFRVIGADSMYELDRYNVWVNDVPCFGLHGMSLSHSDAHKMDKEIAIRLSEGENKIEVSVTNSKGIESYRTPYTVIYSPASPSVPKLYFVGIGIDRFRDPAHPLRYCVKDIHDLADSLYERYGHNMEIDTLFNEQVSTDQVKKIKDHLRRSTVDDKVIIAYSGHGLVSDSFDYYLSTYDVNFSKPEEGGLPYDELESLLDSIPARKKLMLIDACNSGELDKDEVALLNKTIDSTKKGIHLVYYPNEKKLGLKNSFELMQELFANVGRGTGATVLSAAAGTQFAIEDSHHSNGFFTYSILELMGRQRTAKVSELSSYVSSRVEELSNGLQKPTNRRENQDNDWQVW